MHTAKCEARCCGKTEHTGNSEKEGLAKQVLQDPPMYKNPPVCQSSYWNITTCTDPSCQQELLLVLSAGSVWSGTWCQLGQDMVTSRVKKATACIQNLKLNLWDQTSDKQIWTLLLPRSAVVDYPRAAWFLVALLQSWHPGISLPWSPLPGALLRYSVWSQQGSYSKATKPAWLLEAVAQVGSQIRWHCSGQAADGTQCLLKHDCLPLTLREQIHLNAACKRSHSDRQRWKSSI